VYSIPHTRNPRLGLRIFDGGLEKRNAYVLDFFDLDNKQPVNAPEGYKIVLDSVGELPQFMLDEHVVESWETAFDIPRNQLRSGEEKFGLLEDSYCRLMDNGSTILYFAVPKRPGSYPDQYALPMAF
jgi:hypothetical protein